MDPQPNATTPERLLTLQDLAKLFKVSQRTIRRWTDSGRLPEPVRFSKTCIRWRPGVIDAYLDSLAEQRTTSHLRLRDHD